jgi:N-acetylglucosaminyl-diphospho-decaprenol L-rhamnosyltransferase
MPDLSIVIVSWNVADILAECLFSIFATIDTSRLQLDVIVVDSASSDHTVALVHEQFPQVNLLPQSENIGYTKANNVGFEAARGRHILMLNPDTVILDDALERMVLFLDDNPAVGIVGPYTLNTDGTTQSSRRRFPTLRLALVESTWLQPYAPKAWLDDYFVNDAPEDATLDVDWVQGSALMFRREVYEQIGGLDEGYVMYSEEMDFCKRAKDTNWRVVFLGDARIIHHGGKSTEQIAANKHIYFQQSKIRYFHKHHGTLAGGRAAGISTVQLWMGDCHRKPEVVNRPQAPNATRTCPCILAGAALWIKVGLMRIGIITGEYPPMQGGVGAYSQILAHTLS